MTVGGKGDGGIPLPLPRALHVACLAVLLPWSLLMAATYGIIVAGGFVQAIGTDNTPTLQHLLTALSIQHGVQGWFLAGSGWSSLLATLRVALLAMPVTAALGILTAYLLSRQSSARRGAFEFLTMMSFAVPGTVIGVSYILAFNVPLLELTGTATILVIAFVFRNMPVGIRAGLASLSQVDRSLADAGRAPGPHAATGDPAHPAAGGRDLMAYSFVRAITSVSAVIFLVSGEHNLATVYIVGRAEFGEYGIAIMVAALLHPGPGGRAADRPAQPCRGRPAHGGCVTAPAMKFQAVSKR